MTIRDFVSDERFISITIEEAYELILQMKGVAVKPHLGKALEVHYGNHPVFSAPIYVAIPAAGDAVVIRSQDVVKK